MSDKILRAALIGVGNMGKKYVQMIVSGEVSNIKLTAVVIRRDELMEWGEALVNVDGGHVHHLCSVYLLWGGPLCSPSHR